MSDRRTAGASAPACSHGLTTGVCLDDMTPAAREAFEFLFRHAFEYALGADESNADEAETYAAWYTRTYFVDSLDDGPNHREAWLAFCQPAKPAPVERGAGRRIDAARRARERAASRRSTRRDAEIEAAS